MEITAHNGRGGDYTDDFGKELMLANKRKYQLESRVKQIELELKESQQVQKQFKTLFPNLFSKHLILPKV